MAEAYTFGPDGEELIFRITDGEQAAYDRLGSHTGSYVSKSVALGARPDCDSVWQPYYGPLGEPVEQFDTTYLGGLLRQTTVVVHGLGPDNAGSARVTYFPNAQVRNATTEKLGGTPGEDSFKFVDCEGDCFGERTPQVSPQGFIAGPHFSEHIEQLEVPFTTHKGQADHDRLLNAHGVIWDTFRGTILEATVEQATARNKAFRTWGSRKRRDRIGELVDGLEYGSSFLFSGETVRQLLADDPEPSEAEGIIDEYTGISALAGVIAGSRRTFRAPGPEVVGITARKLYEERVEIATTLRTTAATVLQAGQSSST